MIIDYDKRDIKNKRETIKGGRLKEKGRIK
jgi:hypothetical protein